MKDHTELKITSPVGDINVSVENADDKPELDTLITAASGDIIDLVRVTTTDDGITVNVFADPSTEDPTHSIKISYKQIRQALALSE